MSEIQEQKQTASESQGIAAAVEKPEYGRRRSFGELLRADLGFIPVLLTLLVIVIFFESVSQGLFLTPRNLSNLAQQMAEVGIAGLASVLVLLLGEIDLSIAAVAQLCAVVMAVCSE